MASFSSLLTEVRACTLCEADLPLGPRPVLQLHPRARILIAGQAPGRKVHDSGVPFDDASGNRLREWLAELARAVEALLLQHGAVERGAVDLQLFLPGLLAARLRARSKKHNLFLVLDVWQLHQY